MIRADRSGYNASYDCPLATQLVSAWDSCPCRPAEGVKDSGPTGTWTPAGRVGRQVNGQVIQGRYMMIECGTLDIADGEWKMTERWDSGLAGLGGDGLGGQINLASLQTHNQTSQ